MRAWLSGEEAAALAGVTPTAIHNARRAGRLPATRRPGGLWRYDATAVQSYAADVAERRRQAAERQDALFERESKRRTLDATPLLEFIAARGGPAACGIRAAADLELLRLGKASGRLTPAAARRLARRCGVRVGDLWSCAGRLPVEPLLRQVDLRGGPAACGVRDGSPEQKALQRCRETGRITRRQADALAVRVLGLTPWELWPEAGQ